MFKKVICLCAVFIGISVADVLAAPTIRNVNPTSTTAAHRAAATPKKVVKPAATATASTSAVGTQNIKNVSAGSRAPLSNVTKNLLSIKNMKTHPADTGTGSTSGTTSGGSAAPAVSTQEIQEITQRLDNIETQQTENMVTDVVVTGDGAYVTDVDIEGNNIKVEKTTVLYAPVRTGNQEAGTAEIWIVK